MATTTILRGDPSVREGDGAIGGHRSSIRAWLGARLGGWRLDHELARGARPQENPALAARAARLTAPTQRAALAASIERLLRDVDRPPVVSSRAPLNRKAIQAVRGELMGLAAELRSDPTCQPRGIARCRLLLSDGTGPLYGRNGERELKLALGQARASLHLRGSA